MPFAIVGIADSAGVVRLEAFGPSDGPRIGTRAVCLLASITKPIVATASCTRSRPDAWTSASR